MRTSGADNFRPRSGPGSATFVAGALWLAFGLGVGAAARPAAAAPESNGVDVLTPEHAGRGAVEAVLDPAIAPGDPRAAAQAAALERIAGVASAPAWLGGPLGKLLTEGSVPVRPAAAKALASVRTRESLRLLVAAARGDAQPPVRAAALEALARLTGRRDLGSDVVAWERLLGQVSWIPEAEWRLTLAEWLARGVDAAAAERDVAIGRLSAVLGERVAQGSDAPAREAALRSLLRDAYPPVQQLGLTLCLQELANARPLGEPIAGDAAALLVHASATIRRLAAELLGLIGSPGAGPAVAKALELETDPLVATDLLRAAARAPEASSRRPLLRWVVAGEPARSAALSCALVLDEQGLFDDASARSTVLNLLRATRADDLPVAGVRLLLALGDASDRQRVASMLDSGSGPQRAVAAEGLAMHGPSVDTLISAASADPQLRSFAARAVQRFRPTAAGFRELLGLVDPGSDAGRQQVLALASRLSVGELVGVADTVDDPGLRESLLSRLTGEPRRGGAADMELANGLTLLARARLDLRRPGEALKALDAIGTADAGASGAVGDAATLRAVALLCLGKLDEAQRAGAAPGSYLEGLERSIGLVHAGELVRQMQRRWGDDGSALGPGLSGRFMAARSRVEAFVGPSPDLLGP